MEDIREFYLNYRNIDNLLIEMTNNDIFNKVFDKKIENYKFTDSKNRKRYIQFKLEKKTSEFIFGKYGEIKDALLENETIIIDNKEYIEADKKCAVQFLIDLKYDILIYVYNKNTIDFETIFIDYINHKNNLPFSLNFSKINIKNLNQKIRDAKKIKHLIILKKDEKTIQSLDSEFKDFNFSSIQYKIAFKKGKDVDREKLIEFTLNNKNKNYKLEFLDEENINIIASLIQNEFFKAKKIKLTKKELQDTNLMYNILKREVRK